MSTTQAAFDRGAARYDTLVALNPGYHKALRRAASALVERIGRPSGLALDLVDLACGTGASTRALVDAAPAHSVVLGVDASAGMLDRARSKAWPGGVQFRQATIGTRGSLPLDGGRDGVLAAYLFRNVPVADRDRAVAQAYELLRPGGWLVVQEYSIAGRPSTQRVWDAVCWGIIVPLGALVDRNPGLYRYLWRSVHEFDSVDTFAQRLVKAGFERVESTTASGWQRGILHTFAARRPEEHP